MTQRSLHIIGAGGHARVIIQLARACGYTDISVLDDNVHLHGTDILGASVVGSVASSQDGNASAVLAIGSNAVREKLDRELNRNWISLVHPSAIVDDTAVIGDGAVVMAGAIVQAGAILGRHSILNTGATVDHDCVLGDFSHICPGVTLPGNVQVGMGAMIGAGSSSIPGTNIGDWAVIGAGSTVVHSVSDNVTAVGSPARCIEPIQKTEPVPTMSRVFLSPPHMSPTERELLIDAFDSNWIAPMGPHVDAFEKEFADVIDIDHAVALSSGTAALHLALQILGVTADDDVLTSTLTFAATANAIRYVGANPVFIDSNKTTWNMDPELLADELEAANKRGKLPKAVIVVDIMGQCADYEPILKVCRFYEVPVIEDAAEGLGARYNGKSAGHFGDIACFSFNGNKIITTSGGGMLVTQNKQYADRARHLATQARDPGAHYQHSEVGYNYRLSNLLAAVGRGQLSRLSELVDARRANFDAYQKALGDLPGVEFMPEFEGSYGTRWLSCLTIDPQQFGATREDIRIALEAKNIEARPVWKPMHLQPVYESCRCIGGEVSNALFEDGICLPSGSSLTQQDRDRVISIVLSLHVPKSVVATT